jgi:hypothetical protein
MATVNKERHIDIFRRLKYAVRRKRIEKLRANLWFVLYDNAPAHRSVLVKDCLAKNDVIALQRPPHSSDLATGDFYMLFVLKSAVKGRSLRNANDKIKNATGELKSLSKMASRIVSNTLQSLVDVYICARGLFSRKYSLNDYTYSLYFSEFK